MTMRVGDTCWSWAPVKAGDAPVRPRLLTARLAGCEEVGLYDGDHLVMWADAAEGHTAPTEAEAVVGWRAAVVEYVIARRLDDHSLLGVAFHDRPWAFEVAGSLAATIARLEAEREALRVENAALRAQTRTTPIPPRIAITCPQCDGWEGRGDPQCVVCHNKPAYVCRECVDGSDVSPNPLTPCEDCNPHGGRPQFGPPTTDDACPACGGNSGDGDCDVCNPESAP